MSNLKEILARIAARIKNEYYTDLKLTDLAEEYFINRSYLSMAFARELGVSFSRMLIDIRMIKARELLTLSDFSTETIAKMVGFTDHAYFSRAFLRENDEYPSEYRKHAREKIGKNLESYIYISVFKNDPMISAMDMKGLRRFASEMNVAVSIESSDCLDPQYCLEVMKHVISKKPNGIMLCATHRNFLAPITEAIGRGIPVITVDCDLPESPRMATVSSNWHEIGRLQAQKLAELLGYRGKVIALYMSCEASNMADGDQGFLAAIKQYPDIEVVGKYYDNANVDDARRIVLDSLDQHPDLGGIAAFDANSAPGACIALRERKLSQQVKVASVDMSPSHIKLLREGDIALLIGQRRELFTYYGGKILYDYNHGHSIPAKVDTGLALLDKQSLPAIQYKL